MKCINCNVEYMLYASKNAVLFNSNKDPIYLHISVMVCPDCGDINKSTLNIIDSSEEG